MPAFWLGYFGGGGAGEPEPDELLYRRPTFSGKDRVFFDLVAHCPGLNTVPADIHAVLEAEAAPQHVVRSGKIDAAAMDLLKRARSGDWQSLELPGEGGRPAFTIHFTGTGSYHWQRTLPIGLRERVVCDGKTLLHLYPELGLGARRTVSRFHRLDLARLVPYYLPPDSDLCQGADVVAVNDRTIAVVPHGAGAKDGEGKAKKYKQLEMVFDVEDRLAPPRLAERRLVAMPDRKVLAREVHDKDGTIRFLDADDKEVGSRGGRLALTKEGTLDMATRGFVVLPLPYRRPDQVRATLKLEKKALQDLKTDEAITLLASECAAGHGPAAAEVFRQALHPRDRRDLGFYVLLAACGQNLDGEFLDVQAEHPHDPLAQYLALFSSPVLRRNASQWAMGNKVWGDGPLLRLATAHALCQRWQSGKAIGGTDAQRKAELQRALDFVKANPRSAVGWAVLSLIAARADEDLRKNGRDIHRDLVDAWKLFEDAPGLEYAARYERGCSLFHSGKRQAVRELFLALYDKTLATDELPPIDSDFRRALADGDKDEWSSLMRRTAAKLVEQKHRGAVLALASQCWQVDDQTLANDLLTVALDKVDDKERLALTIAVVEFQIEAAQLAEADETLRKLLDDAKLAKRGDLWRLAGKVAEQRDQPARELECLERALDVEYDNLPEVINVRQVAGDYERLLKHYRELADSMVTLRLKPPADFRARVLRAADRWRALTLDSGSPCEMAGRILQRLGEGDLAWDYLTTPIALRPNEAEPWRKLGQTLAVQGRLDLADRAYAAAFETEPTDAQLLWERAENLRRAGRKEEAARQYRRLVEGEWQPRFSNVVNQARERLKGS
jgi:tetratricopeptide (TPR) repeat protein